MSKRKEVNIIKIPKEIKQHLIYRERLALELMMCDSIISEWLDNNAIPVDSSDYRTGVEMYMNPIASKNRILGAIERK